MFLYLCPKAKECNAGKCIHKEKHEKIGVCDMQINFGVFCSVCVPVEEVTRFNEKFLTL